MHSLSRWSVKQARIFSRLYHAFRQGVTGCSPVLEAIGYERLERPVTSIERAAKSLFFDCRMCGDCLLSTTGMSCPMNCPKQVRNGPCGGVRPGGSCEVNPQLSCVWAMAREGCRQMGVSALPATPNNPVEWNKVRTSTWLRLDKENQPQITAAQPVPTTSFGRLEQVLRAGHFAVTAEMSPPDSADPEDVRTQLANFKGLVDAINVTDGSGANCHMSSLAVSALVAQANLTPVMQITCRDRNRIAVQGDILGAAALGIKDILCITGDHIGNGDHPGAKPVNDLDSVTLLQTARRLRDEGQYLSGRKLTTRPRLFLGAVDNPFAEPFDMRPLRLARKIEAGAQFVQTQYCFDVPLLKSYMEQVREMGLHKKCFILIGVGPLASARTARWIRKNVPGVHIPESIIERLEGAQDQRKEGKRLCVELIQQIHKIEGVAGIHLMAFRQEHLLGELLADSGILAERHPEFRRPYIPEMDRPKISCSN